MPIDPFGVELPAVEDLEAPPIPSAEADLAGDEEKLPAPVRLNTDREGPHPVPPRKPNRVAELARKVVRVKLPERLERRLPRWLKWVNRVREALRNPRS